jgi:hypothetical protein
MTPYSPPHWPALATAPHSGVGMLLQAGMGAAVKNNAFQQVLAGVQPGNKQVEVVSGDTLIGLVKAHYRQNQMPISEGQAMQLAQQVARHNQLADPDLILPGQKIDFAPLQLPALARAPQMGPLDISSPLAAAALNRLSPSAPETDLTAHALAARSASLASGTSALQTNAPPSDNGHSILERTLGRAVEKGFVAAQDLAAVRQKVMGLAQRYNFAPDDFARLTLMESGGMNPQASNGSCHGIIQFCDGANRGAAAVGLKNNPRSILGMGLLQQLDLVDKYFSQAGLPAQSPNPGQNPGKKLGLDDLYLTVLTPAARQETRPNAPLPIAGPQARHLHVDGDTRQPITRNSILSGLHAMTDSLLGLTQAKTPGSRWYADAAKTTSDAWR